MKTTILLLFIFTIISSCSSQNEEMCECHEMQLQAAKEYEEIKNNFEKLEAFENKYREKQKECSDIVSRVATEMKKLSDEEKAARKKEYIENCPAFAELERMQVQNQPAEHTQNTVPELKAVSNEFSGIKIGMKKEDVEKLGYVTNIIYKPIDQGGISLQTEVMEIKTPTGELIAEAHNYLNGLNENGILEIDIVSKKPLTQSGVKLNMSIKEFVKAHPNSDIMWNSISKRAFITSDDFVNYRFYFSEAAFPENFNVQATNYEVPETVLDIDVIDQSYSITAIKVGI